MKSGLPQTNYAPIRHSLCKRDKSLPPFSHAHAGALRRHADGGKQHQNSRKPYHLSSHLSDISLPTTAIKCKALSLRSCHFA